MEKKQLKDLKKGELFRLKESETAPLWVRDEYDRTTGTFIVYKYDDVNHFSNRKRTRTRQRFISCMLLIDRTGPGVGTLRPDQNNQKQHYYESISTSQGLAPGLDRQE